MAAIRIREEDLAGVTLAVLAHAGLIVWLALAPHPSPPPPVERVTVTFEAPVAAEAGSPSREQARTAVAPILAPEPAPAPPPAPVPVPQPAPKVAPPPPQPAPPKPVVKPAPQPAPVQPSLRPAPRPLPPTPAPQPKALTPPAPVKPAPQPAPRSQVSDSFLKGVQAPKVAPSGSRVSDNFMKDVRPPTKQAGGSRIGDKFLDGVNASGDRGKATTPPGPALTPQVRASLAMALSRELKPHWQSPNGLEVELLATTIEWDLKPDGTLDGPPRFVSQSGVSPANRPQADRHREQAIRAIRLAAPFSLPPQFYAGWQHVRFTFDRKLD